MSAQELGAVTRKMMESSHDVADPCRRHPRRGRRDAVVEGSQSHPVLYVVVAVGYAIAFAVPDARVEARPRAGVAYGIWGAGGVALTAVLSWAVFGEALTPVMMVGIGLVIVGVLLVETGSTVDPTL